MKHVFNTGEIPHLWMHQTQPSARNQQGNLFFEGDTIYSYGSHFPIAKHVVNAAGEKAILLTTASYSVTTSGHIGDVKRAIHGNDVKLLLVPDPSLKPSDLVQQIDSDIASARKACFGSTGRFRPTKWEHLQHTVDRANDYLEFIRSTKRFSMPVDAETVKVDIAKAAASAIRKQQRRNAAIAKERAAHHAELEAKYNAWLHGESVDVRDLYYFPVALRVVGDVVETSKGVEIPISHAIRGLTFVRKVMADNTPYQRNGHTFYLGPYAIDRIDVNGTLKAGCHIVTYDAIARIAPFLDNA